MMRGPVFDAVFAVLAFVLAGIPAGHFEVNGIGAGLLSLLAIFIWIEVIGWAMKR